MSICGQFVTTFDEATHALPDGMHMNADYPFKLPKIVDRDDRSITIEGRAGARATLVVQHDAAGHEFCELAQSSTFEKLWGRPPTKFKLVPFKGETL